MKGESVMQQRSKRFRISTHIFFSLRKGKGEGRGGAGEGRTEGAGRRMMI